MSVGMIVVLSIHRESPCGFNDSDGGKMCLHLLCSERRWIGRVVDNKGIAMKCGVGEVLVGGYLFLGDPESR